MDPHCEPLRDYLEPAASMLDPFELEKMRYRRRLWCHFDCNWKTAMEAFIESFHVEGTHPPGFLLVVREGLENRGTPVYGSL